MTDRLKWGVLGNATIARVCVIPAIVKSRNGIVYALATRSPRQASEVIKKNHIGRVYDDYHALIEDKDVREFYMGIRSEESIKGFQRWKRKKRWR